MTENNDNLKRLRAIRSGNRAVVTKYTNEAVELLQHEDEKSKSRLRTIESLLNEKITKLKELDAQILELCEIEEIVQEIEVTEDIYSRACDVSREIEKFASKTSTVVSQVSQLGVPLPSTSSLANEVLANEETSQTNTDTSPGNHQQIQQQQIGTFVEQAATEVSNLNAVTTQQPRTSIRSKLPKLVLQKFKGDITNYRAFWESFESSVHKNGQ